MTKFHINQRLTSPECTFSEFISWLFGIANVEKDKIYGHDDVTVRIYI